ncbi:hypothetical protein PT273_00535 [Orbaceae bacterium ESL0727]|nr:hypothetical protein [Orbaceae bacterium ESL0727]
MDFFKNYLIERTNFYVEGSDKKVPLLKCLGIVIRLCIIPMLLSFSLPFSAQALLAMTTGTIQGSAPYFTFDGGVTKVTNADGLLWIKLSNGKLYNKANNVSSSNNPITLPVVGQSMADVKMLIPTTTDNLDINTLVGTGYDYWRDDNGDGQGADGITATGTLTIRIYNVDNVLVNRSDKLEPCGAPYRVVLSSTSGSLKTQYGNPNATNFSAATVTYYIKPIIEKPQVCFAQPNLEYTKYNGVSLNGPASQWNEKKGFILQDINNPSINFPTMGAKNFYFNLSLAGVSAKNISYESTPTTSGLTLSITGSDNVAKVQLKGPGVAATVAEASTVVPTTFTLYADKNKQNKLYSFTLKNWLIANPNDGGGFKADYCSKYGSSYRIPSINDLTNSRDRPGNGRLPSYERHIGGGFIAEWGNIVSNYYQNTDFTKILDSSALWTSEIADNNEYYIVTPDLGRVASNNTNMTGFKYACITP